MASHEFRTPLTVIDGHARRLDKIKDAVAPAEIGERAGKIRSAVLRMTQLIDNLLNSSRLIDGGAGLYFNVGRMDMRALLQEVCQLHREMVPGSQLNERFAATPMPMVGDAKLLFQVFSNLLSNAVKYSPGGRRDRSERWKARRTRSSSRSPIMASASRQAISARLFERYHRGSNVSGIVGTGVGLYLVKMAVDLHRGSVEVQSKEGEGSRFTVRLPRAALTVDKSPSATAPLMADA